jgi:hypothetical protein
MARETVLDEDRADIGHKIDGARGRRRQVSRNSETQDRNSSYQRDKLGRLCIASIEPAQSHGDIVSSARATGAA